MNRDSVRSCVRSIERAVMGTARMINISTGRDVDRLFSRIIGHPQWYASVTLCSPFIDEEMLDRILPLATSAKREQCALQLITSEDAVEKLRKKLSDPRLSISRLFIAPPRLHAKIYLGLARRANDSEAIVTSANLTGAGMSGNIELGVRATPTTAPGRRLLEQVNHFVRQMAA